MLGESGALLWAVLGAAAVAGLLACVDELRRVPGRRLPNLSITSRAAAAPRPPPGLDEDEFAILKFLGRQEASAAMLAAWRSASVGLMQFYLKALDDSGLVRPVSCRRWAITKEGRTLIGEQGYQEQ